MMLATATARATAPPLPGIRVFLAEDHAVTLLGLEQLICASDRLLNVVGTAGSSAELVNHPALADTDVLLLDLNLGGQNAIDAMPDLQRRCPGHVLVLTATDDAGEHRQAMMKGARGVLHKSAPAETILRAIERVHAGEVWLAKGLLGEVMGMLTGAGKQPAPRPDIHARRIASLTLREREIVCVMVRSAGAKLLTVADSLSMSEHTLRNHLTTIYAKLELHGRLALHVYATEHGLGAIDSRGALA